MIKVIILSRAADAPGLHPDPIDNELLADGNLALPGIARLHTRLASATAAHAPGYTAVAICQHVTAFLETIAALAHKLGTIELLDIVGHGGPGRIHIGDETLFEADEQKLVRGQDTARTLKRYLAPGARVRLLGCKTGLGEQGQTLIASLGMIFGPLAITYGTIDRVIPAHFHSGEFSQVRELLYSSEAATDYAAVDTQTRGQHIDKLTAALDLG